LDFEKFSNSDHRFIVKGRRPLRRVFSEEYSIRALFGQRVIRGLFFRKNHCHKDASTGGSGFPFSILNGGCSIHEKN
jgi:hypothetical protein